MRYRVILLTVACVLATSAVTVADAAAVEFSPTDGRGFPVPFTSTVGVVSLVSPDGTVVCVSGTNLGEILNKSELKVTVRLKRCNGPLGLQCTTAGQNAGEILIAPLRGYFVNLAKGTKFGVLLLPEGANPKKEYPASTVTTFTCGNGNNKEDFKVTGGVIGQITAPAKNVVSNKSTLTIEAAAGGQEFKKADEEAGVEYYLRSNGKEGSEKASDNITLCEKTKEVAAGEGACTGERKGEFK